MDDLTDLEVETRYPGALAAFDEQVGMLRERTSFYEDGHLYAETLNGCTYTWSPEDGEWFDS